MKNKICFIVTGLGMGGAERQVCDLADELQSIGNNIIIISLTGDSIVRPKSEEVEIIELHMKKTPIEIIKCFILCRSILKKFNPDVIHSHMVHANLFARTLRLFYKMPLLICTAHSTNEGGKWRMVAYKLTDFLADLTTNVSDASVDAFVQMGAVKPGKMIAIGNGLNIDKFVFSAKLREEKRNLLKLDRDDILYLAIGRLQPEKDYPNLLNAFSLVVKHEIKNNKKVKLVIIGPGYLELELKQLTTELGLDNYVTFLGIQYDVEKWLSAADCFVLSSEYEGFGLVVGEALLVERPVVATNCGGVKEVLGEYGCLVPPKDFKAFAEGMLNIFKLPSDELINITKNGRKRIIENYSIRSVAKKWLDIYQINK